MPYAPIMHGKSVIEIELSRYDELISREEELYRLKKAISEITPYSSDINLIKKFFDIEPEIKETTESEEK